MRFRTITALLISTAILAACSDSATAPTSASLEAELAAVVQERSASPNELASAQDRRDGRRPVRDALTERQKSCIEAAVAEFRAANKGILDELEAIHKQAREARAAGATRQEIARILNQAAPLLERLRAANEALHKKIRACLND